MTTQIRLAALFAISALLGLPAMAADAPSTERLEHCVEISDNAARLACYDAAMARAQSSATEIADSEGKIDAAEPLSAAAPPDLGDDYVVLKKEEAEELRRRAGVDDDFVLLPKEEAEELRRRADADERAVKREPYESQIVRVFTTGYNTRNVELENGETWREMKDAAGTKPRRGETARLAPASLGSWTVQYGGRSAKFKVKRVR